MKIKGCKKAAVLLCLLIVCAGCADINEQRLLRLEKQVAVLQMKMNMVSAVPFGANGAGAIQGYRKKKVTYEALYHHLQAQPVRTTATKIKRRKVKSDHSIRYSLSMKIKNNSGHTVKDVTIAVMGFDKNGFPVKWIASGKTQPSTFIRFISLRDIHLLDGKSFDEPEAFVLEENNKVFYPLSCIVFATFYDQEKYVNPYFEIWNTFLCGFPLPVIMK